MRTITLDPDATVAFCAVKEFSETPFGPVDGMAIDVHCDGHVYRVFDDTSCGIHESIVMDLETGEVLVLDLSRRWNVCP